VRIIHATVPLIRKLKFGVSIPSSFFGSASWVYLPICNVLWKGLVPEKGFAGGRCLQMSLTWLALGLAVWLAGGAAAAPGRLELHVRRSEDVCVAHCLPPLFGGSAAAAINSGLGVAMRRARPTAPSRRMVSQVTSSSHQVWPWRAERGSAWWLLCHPSPLLT
jgi:hypothetical protein